MRKPANTFVLFLLCLSFVLSEAFVSEAQMHQPVKWHFTAVPVSESEASLIFTATLEEGWHVYSQFIEEGGPLPTTFTFEPSNDYSLVGIVKEESTPVKSYDKTFMMEIVWFSHTAIFTQKVKLRVPAATVKGSVEFMACTDEICLLPSKVNFNLEVKPEKSEKKNSGQ